MSLLDQVAQKFVAPGVFPGASIADKVVSGARLTKAILQQYALDTAAPLADPPASVQTALSVLAANEEKSASILGQFSDLASAMNPANDPVVLQMAPGDFLASVLWAWRSAAAGVPVYASGYTDVLTASGDPQWSAANIVEDAQRRILVFQAIVQLQQWGILQSAYDKIQAQGSAARLRSAQRLHGFGGPEVIAAIPIQWILIGAVTLVVLFWIAWSTYQNGKVFDKVCSSAAELKNEALLAKCIEEGAAKKDPFQAFLEKLVYVGGAVAIGYILVTYAMPQLLERRAVRALPA